MRAITKAVAGAVMLLLGSSSFALQFDPAPTARLHTSTQPGAEWNTGGPSAGGSIVYDQGSGTLTVVAALDVLNYYDTAPGSGCESNTSSNCAFNYGPDLDIGFSASFVDLVVQPVFGSIVEVIANFETTGGVDLTVTDPDFGGATALEAKLAAGDLNAEFTTGLSASIFYDTVAESAFGTTVNAVGVWSVDETTAYKDLFGPEFIGIFSAATNAFVNGGPSGGGLSEVVRDSLAAGTLVGFTAEGTGQVFAAASGEFLPLPEPATVLLLAVGAAATLSACRRRESR